MAELEPYLQRLESADREKVPLYGVPFAIKDNIDLDGVPTSAACPEFAYRPDRSAYVVQLLIDAGAIPLGKTNMDQFATGLVGLARPNLGDPAEMRSIRRRSPAVQAQAQQLRWRLGW